MQFSILIIPQKLFKTCSIHVGLLYRLSIADSYKSSNRKQSLVRLDVFI